jgi:hypothetical protein
LPHATFFCEQSVTGITASGQRAIIESVELNAPEYGKVADLPASWFVTNAGIAVAQSTPTAFASIFGRAILPIGSVTLNPEALRKLNVKLVGVIDDTGVALNSPNAEFNIRVPGKRGPAIELIYQSLSNSNKHFGIIQGHGSSLRIKLQQQIPDYLTSTPDNIFMDGSLAKVWIGAGGNLEKGTPKQQIAMFEVDNWFIYVVGENTSVNELRALLTLLSKVR